MLRYNPDTGDFIGATGKILTAISNGYRTVTYKGKTVKAHRMAWFIMTGQWPTKEIDHIDRNKLNNRWNNLRESTRSENNVNRDVRADSVSGIKNIRFRASMYYVEFKRNKVRYDLGCFKTLEEAQLELSLALKKFS